jgi:nitroreductase
MSLHNVHFLVTLMRHARAPSRRATTPPGRDDAARDARGRRGRPPRQAFRVLVIEGEARHAFGELMAASAKRGNPAIDEAGLEATRKKSQRAPMILVVACTPKAHPKVPEIEQVITAGCLAHTVLLGLQAAGYGAMWRTGPAAYDDALKTDLGLRPGDHIVGFLYVGTPASEPPALPRPSTNDFVSRWSSR